MTFEESGRARILEDRLRKSTETIRSTLLEMGKAVELATGRAERALISRDRSLAYSIILRDRRIDGLEKEVDRLCLEYLVREQPVAGLLRFVYSTMKINTGLERVGDYAESVARQVLLLDVPGELPCRQSFEELGELSRKMLHDSLRAYAEQNVELAGATIELEGRADEIRSQIRRDLLDLSREEGASIDFVTPLLISAARFERVADHAVDICDEVLFMCTGHVAKHPDDGLFHVLFLSEHDSTRSQMAVGIARSLGLPEFAFESAGVAPRIIGPRTLAFMDAKGIDLSAQVSKSYQQIRDLDHYHAIVLLSKSAAAIARRLPDKPVLIHWLTPDPSNHTGTEEEVRAAYERTFAYLGSHIREFVQAVLRDNS
jgi:phosphate transport system protein